MLKAQLYLTLLQVFPRSLQYRAGCYIRGFLDDEVPLLGCAVLIV